jgi:hypothetical protein
MSIRLNSDRGVQTPFFVWFLEYVKVLLEVARQTNSLIAPSINSLMEDSQNCVIDVFAVMVALQIDAVIDIQVSC